MSDRRQYYCQHCDARAPVTDGEGRLIWALRHPPPDRRLMVAAVLGNAGGERAARQLRELVYDPDPYLAAAALRSFVSLVGTRVARPTGRVGRLDKPTPGTAADGTPDVLTAPVPEVTVVTHPIRIASVDAYEILDSRARPTLMVLMRTDDGRTASAGVPAGASTGRKEAVELRDGEHARYGGQGVLRAVASVTGEIADLLVGRTWVDQSGLDAALIDLDGTDNRGRLGANAVVGVSMAAARLFAADLPLWRHLGGQDSERHIEPRLPVPHFNVLNGGAHARNELDFQEFMIAPLGAHTMADAIRCGAEIYAALRGLLSENGYDTGLGDEGGFAPRVTQPEDALRLLVRAIENAGYPAGVDGVAVAIDPAASQFYRDDGSYLINGQRHTSSELVARYVELVRDYPLWSIEDGMAEDDPIGWSLLYRELGEHVQIMGDDVFVTDAGLIAAGAQAGMANSALIKLNQVGTVTETLQAIRTCRDHDMTAMVSHRSGETSDDFIADLAVGCGCGQLKSGAPARGERVAKYNRLLAIARENPALPYGLPESTLAPIHAG